MVNSRQAMHAKLAAVLPVTWTVMATAREFDTDPSVPAYVAMMRQQVAPAPNARGAWMETFHVWVITPSLSDSPELEDNLDGLLDEVLMAFNLDDTIYLDSATRDVYGEKGLHCWLCNVQAISVRID